jgi:flavin-dependent dehydrogenase
VPPSASAPGYVCRRMDFDNFLIREIKNKPQISFWEDTEIIRYERTSTGFLLYEKEGKIGFNCRLLLVADGAHSAFARKIAGLAKDPAHHAASVRAYYKGVGGTEGSSLIELHFLKSILPGYFWIFPLPDGHANVGLGIRSDVVARKRINLRKEFENLMRTHPALRERFAGAELEGIIEGYGLPLGSRQLPISGDHYMLLGDAGHLIDPLTGEGIGNAFYSGIIAAEQAQQCLDKGNFSAEFLRDYDKRVARVLGSEMNLSYRLQRLLSYPKVANTLARIMAGNSKLLGVFTRMYNDFELRLQLVNPLFWLKMWWSKKG